ncbi:hypothetical protein [Kitasatospora sp. NPDC127116]|uniref:hypothetical protein n=1 Tax=Kitasatospora sp. NPDC127116 TaxID=3345367 RepID=UPI0036421FF1
MPNYDDPFADISPWDEKSDLTETPTVEETPMTTPATADNEGFCATLKFGPGYDAPWLVMRDGSADGLKRKIGEAKESGLLETMGKASAYVVTLAPSKADKAAGQPSFSGGRVQNSAGAESGHKGDLTCDHGARTHVAKGTWEAYFCNADERAGEAKCPPAFLDKKTGKFAVKR